MEKKICFKCELEKDLSEFYKQKNMVDGHLNKCKECTKKGSKDNYNKKSKDPSFIESEKARGREKYERLHKGWKKVSKEVRFKSTKTYRLNFPEKYSAHKASQGLKKEDSSNHLHHWSYNEQHYVDVIEINKEEHIRIHRYLVYDQEYMMYRTLNNELLDTKEKHVKYLDEICRGNE